MDKQKEIRFPKDRIKLQNLFEFLEKINLHEPLMQWFNKAYSHSIEGKIISLNFAYELYLGNWRHHRFGYKLSEEFSLFLKDEGNNFDPVQIAKNFCLLNNKFRFFGITSKFQGNIIHVIRLEHLIDALEAQYLDLYLTDFEIICQEIKFLLNEKKVQIGHRGIAWFTLFDNNLIKEKDALSICNCLGIDFIKNRGYVILSLRHNNLLRRPTIFDGGLNIKFRPDCKKCGWGLTLPTDLSEEKSCYESVMTEHKHNARVEKFLPPLDGDLCVPDNKSLNQYLKRMKNKFKKKSQDAYQDLEKAWKFHEKWW